MQSVRINPPKNWALPANRSNRIDKNKSVRWAKPPAPDREIDISNSAHQLGINILRSLQHQINELDAQIQSLEADITSLSQRNKQVVRDLDMSTTKQTERFRQIQLKCNTTPDRKRPWR